MQPLILDLNFWHRSFLTIIMVDHYPFCEFLHAAKLLVALCYVALASSPRHQHLRCFHFIGGSCTTSCVTLLVYNSHLRGAVVWLFETIALL